MKIIVPMAGIGSRLRPHTLTIPKPLTLLAGKPIVQRLVEDIAKVLNQKIEEIAFVIGPTFPADTEEKLKAIAKDLNATCIVTTQNEALGTAHAIQCAKESLSGPCVVAFADTLFKADFTLNADADGAIWVKQVENPNAYGVIKLKDGIITDFVEKPTEFVSDLAIIGIYYFKDGDKLLEEINHLIDNDIRPTGEFQLTEVL
jgi:glucose-1-phosphate thymidylyltransferase